MNKKYRSQIMLHITMFFVFAVLFIIGTFNDEAIAKKIYSPDHRIFNVVTAFGASMFFISYVFLFGALTQRTVNSGYSTTRRNIHCAIMAGLSVVTGFSGAAELWKRDCLGAVFPALFEHKNAAAAVTLVPVLLLFYAGYRLAESSQDNMLAKRIAILLLIMLAAVILMHSLKYAFSRPRYRTAILGYEGIGYVPWYKPFKGASGFISEFGIESGEFRSFPSGHSLLSVSLLSILQSLTWLSPKLKDKEFCLCIAGYCYGITIMLSRMLLGAHYLSDVTAGAMIAVMLSLIHIFMQSRIPDEQTPQH